jgi:hypothetical protein
MRARGARDIHRIAVKMPATGKPRPIKPAAELGPVMAKPYRVAAKTRPALTGPARGRCADQACQPLDQNAVPAQHQNVSRGVSS